MTPWLRFLYFVAAGFATAAWIVPGAQTAVPSAQEIVQRSVANNEKNWEAAPDYTYDEKDIITKGGRTTIRSYRVLMIGGSPYDKLTGENGEPLAPKQAATQEAKLRREIERRNHETAAQRKNRISEYERERRQDHDLMDQMMKGFDYKLLGEETIHGRRCYALIATPRPGYVPTSRDTKVLTGMRGKMWVDAEDFQWVKIHAEVFRPVTFGLFIARVQPGTEFDLDEAPVAGGLWMPSHFVTRVKAQILWWSHNSVDDETYWNYQKP